MSDEKVCPQKATNEMLYAAERVSLQLESYTYYRTVWQAMYDAAPTGIPRPPTFPDKRFGLSEDERDNALAAWNAVANDESLRQDITHLPLCMYAVYAAGKRAGIPRDDARDLIVDLTAGLESLLYPDFADKRVDLRKLNERALRWIDRNAMTSESGEQKSSGERV